MVVSPTVTDKRALPEMCVCGFFLVCEDFWRIFDSSFPICTFKKIFAVSGDKVMHTNFTLLGQDQSTVAEQVEMTVAKCSLMSCV